jgi:hypothetical protein
MIMSGRDPETRRAHWTRFIQTDAIREECHGCCPAQNSCTNHKPQPDAVLILDAVDNKSITLIP